MSWKDAPDSDLAEITAHDRRRAALERDWGKPERFGDTTLALGFIGRQDIDPAEVIAFRYRDQDAADAWQHSTLVNHDVASLGTAMLGRGLGVVGVYDLRLG